MNKLSFILFNTGKRKCPGENLAKTTTFLLMANLLSKFNLSIPPGNKRPSTKPVVGLNLSPEPFLTCVTPR